MISAGTIANKLLKKVNKDHPTIHGFLSNTLKAYAECATFMTEKLHLENKFLKNIAAIDPMTITSQIAITSQKSIVLKSLLKLPFLMKNILVNEEAEMYENDCQHKLASTNRQLVVAVKQKISIFIKALSCHFNSFSWSKG